MRGVGLVGDTTESKPGARPIRMKGFYRAVKRGESWAVEIDKLTGLNRIFALSYRTIDFASFFKNSSARRDRLFNKSTSSDLWHSAVISDLDFGKKDE